VWRNSFGILNYKNKPQSSKISQTQAHLLYSLGRVLTYSILGALFGALGNAVIFGDTARGGLFIFAGVAIILAGLSLMGNLNF